MTKRKTAAPQSAPDPTAPVGLDAATSPIAWLQLGVIGRPHGLRGELRVVVHNPHSDIWQPRQSVRAYKPGAPAQFLKIVSLRPAVDVWIVAFAGIDDRDAAAAWTHAVLQIDPSQLPAADTSDVYLHQLIGATVIDSSDGSEAGQVVATAQGAQTLLCIRLRDGKEAMVPVDSEAVEELGRDPGRVVIRHVRDWLT
ncbi:MAG: 16S rRNA processing protein RimM [Myxococcales bacterium]|nr:16S rRNA processing protein RimM [Myxococcales bacterium]